MIIQKQGGQSHMEDKSIAEKILLYIEEHLDQELTLE